MTKARDIASQSTIPTAVSSTELGYVDGVTSAIQTQMDSKLATATASSTYEPTLPSQTGNSGKYLTTNGTAKSWGTVSQYALPTQTGNSGKFLTTNGTAESWGTVATGSMTLLSTTTLSGATTTISGIDQSYTHLYAYWSQVTSTSNYILYCKPNNVLSTSQNYIDAGTAGYTAGTYLKLSSASLATAGNSGNSGSLIMYNYTTVDNKPFLVSQSHFNGSVYMYFGQGTAPAGNAAITSLVLSPSVGSFNGGTFYLYGVK